MTKMVTLEEAQKLQLNIHTEAQATIKQLVGRQHLASVQALDAQVHDELPADKKSSLLVRSDHYFKSLLAGWTGALFGAMKKKNLIGKVAVLKVESWRIGSMMDYVTYPDPDGAASALCGEDSIAIIQSLCVLKDHKSGGLGQGLLKAAKAWAKDTRCSHLFAQVGKNNVCSSLEFSKQGFEFYAGWQGKDHGRYLMRAYGNDPLVLAPVVGHFSVPKDDVYPKEDAAGNVVRPSLLTPIVDLHLAAGRRVRLNLSPSTSNDLHFDLV